MNKKIYILFHFIFFNLFGKYTNYEIKIIKNNLAEGYKKFDYAIWLHPLQLINMDLQTFLIKPVLDKIKKLIPDDSVAIDIGAHTGDTSVAYSLILGNTGKVIAFEPNPLAYEVLKVNSELNNNIIPYNLAITETEGEFTFHYTDIGLCNGGFGEVLQYGPAAIGTVPLKVKGVNFEKWIEKNHKELLQKIKFIKIDTEGYDKNIIKSMKNFINKYQPTIQAEVYTGLSKDEKIEFFNIIKSINYKCFLYQNFEVGKKELNLSDFTNIQHSDIICFPIND
jgi:FkbM family methyltransferase